MVKFSHVRKREKTNRTDIYWGVVKVCVYDMGVLKHFASWGIETFWAQNL